MSPTTASWHASLLRPLLWLALGAGAFARHATAAPFDENLRDAYKQMATATSSLTLSTYTSGDKSAAVNSHLIVANDAAMLVDAQLTKHEAKRLVKMIQKTGKPLTTIFITHAHPDHYLGLPIVREAFPKAQVVASPAVAKAIKERWPVAVAALRETMDVADPGVAPTPLQDKKLMLAGNVIEVLTLDGGECDHASALYVPSLNVLISGDLVFNKVHLWLAEQHADKWLQLLDEVAKGRTIGAVLSGHGDPGTSALLDDNKKYLRAFIAVQAQALTPDAKIAEMKKQFPDYKGTAFLEKSFAGVVK